MSAVSDGRCPNCGAPAPSGTWTCAYCHATTDPAHAGVPSLAQVASLVQSRGEALDQSLPQLAAVLSAALPGAVQVEREGGLLRHSDRIKQLSVDTGEFRFLLQRQGSALQAVVSHEVGGIVLKSEKLPAAEWLIQLGERLRQIAVNAEQINPALARLLGADGQR